MFNTHSVAEGPTVMLPGGMVDLPAALAAVGSIVDLPTAEEIQNGSKGNLNVTYELPQRLNVGMSLQITPKWKTSVDVRWTEWSAFSDIYTKTYI
ncbi:hypothetical protein FT643_19785 [Ketobacter sp. MCCC 1A13808]|nr:hypothetical protein [Ketobacter sp. MCCC 1A13808]